MNNVTLNILLLCFCQLVSSCGHSSELIDLKNKSSSIEIDGFKKIKSTNSTSGELKIKKLAPAELLNILNSHKALLHNDIDFIIGDTSLYDTRSKIELAKSVMNNTRRIIPNTINQFHDIYKDHKTYYQFILHEILTSYFSKIQKVDYDDLSLDYGYQLASAMVTGNGVCNDHALLNLLALCSIKHDFPVYYCFIDSPIHYFCILGDYKQEDAVLIDSWTKDAEPVLFCDSKLKLKNMHIESFSSLKCRKKHFDSLKIWFEMAMKKTFNKQNYESIYANNMLILDALNDEEDSQEVIKECQKIFSEYYPFGKDYHGRFICNVSSQKKGKEFSVANQPKALPYKIKAFFKRKFIR